MTADGLLITLFVVWFGSSILMTWVTAPRRPHPPRRYTDEEWEQMRLAAGGW